MHSTETDVTQSEIEHYLNMRVPCEFDDKPLSPSGIATKSHCQSLAKLLKSVSA